MTRLLRAAGMIPGLCAFVTAPMLLAQPAGRPTAMIQGAVNEAQVVTLTGNTRSEANAQNDRGPVADSLVLEHMLLKLKRSPEREAALEAYIDELENRSSSNYHQWLTPAQFAEHFGVAQADVDVVTAWLKAGGFTVSGALPTGLMIDFSGTAAQVRNAFHTEIHNLEVGGAKQIANMSDPQIPAALEAVVAGVVSLNSFHPKPQLVPKGNYTFTTSNGTFHALVPGDLETIYNINPVYTAGYSGQGQSIMVLEDTYVYTVNDWASFRNTFGLTRTYPSGTFTQVSPAGSIACSNPGFQGSPSDPGYGDDGEAILDAEWASAAAPNAAIVLAACKDTLTTFGGLIALENVLNGPATGLPSVVSISYGEAEAQNGAAANLAYKNAYQQAVSEGVAIFVSSGDEGAAIADAGKPATHGIGVSAFASTAYNVAVGGTDFGYTADNVNPATYWGSTNKSDFSSALSYIQEIPWNNSCAGSLLAAFLGSNPIKLCNSSDVVSASGSLNFLLTAVAASGGPSGCATGAPTSVGIVGGTCKGYAKPSWQAGLFGNPKDGVRDVPDVSLFAANGLWDAYYVICWSNPDQNVGGGFNCTGAPSTWAGVGGTSVSTPIMAGIQTLVNQKTASRWGNPNPTYYSMAKTEFGAAGSGAPSCNSTTVVKIGSPCVFYDVTEGDIDVVCKPSLSGVATDCFRFIGYYGILSLSNQLPLPTYKTKAGWDFSTGIGTVNALNMVMNWPTN